MTGIAAMTIPSRGRTRITPRAFSRIVAAVTADTLGVKPDDVGVDLGDDHGLLAVTVSARIRVVSLTRIQQDDRIVERTGGTLLERCAHAQHAIRDRVTALTGSQVGHVTVRLTGTDIRAEKGLR